jgi:hypothetical protein
MQIALNTIHDGEWNQRTVDSSGDVTLRSHIRKMRKSSHRVGGL